MLLLAIVALALSPSSGVALAEGCIGQTNWIDGNSSWFPRANWDNGVPTAGASAEIDNGGTANIDSAGAEACNLILGYQATKDGNVSVNGNVASLTVGSEVEVGAFGKGNLSITNGGTVSAGLLTIAVLSSASVGSVSVDGSTLTIGGRCDVGGDNGTPGGLALLNVTNSGTVTVTAGYLSAYKSGTLTGNGTVSTTSGTTIDGTLKPKGTLTIGGDLTFTGPATMQCNVTQSSWDRVEVSGTATLNGKLSVTLTGFFTGDFPLLHASGLTGSFSSLSATYTGCLAPSIVYDRANGYVYLHVEATCQ